MKSHEVREQFLRYFEKHAHQRVSSSSLIPDNDPTLLFTNAGMNQFKNCFLGLEKRDYLRATTSQKCVRAGGKHNDLENVGFTARHHTFFEMLGNFSFGDYFKKDAIHFAWELLTKEFGIPKDKLYVTVFEKDDEAAEIWHQQENIPRDRIFRFGEKDNFWRMGDTGPCGPSTEIFYDHGPGIGKETDPYKGIASGEDRFVEIWNLVFMQFYEKSPGVMDPLPKPSVDTGSGLERVTAALQGHSNNYNTDLFAPLLTTACKKLGWDLPDLLEREKSALREFEKNSRHGDTLREVQQNLAALRVLADHARATAFLITDGALPSNEGRGYVLRRIMRRAIRYGRKLSVDQSFLPAMVEAVIQNMQTAYPELEARRQLVATTVREEEQRFLQALDTGTQILGEELKKISARGQKVLPGEVVFKLYDTYGFPTDLTGLMAAESGFSIDESGFESQMHQARQKAKSSWKGRAAQQGNEAHIFEFTQTHAKSRGHTQFRGYESLSLKTEVLALSNGDQQVDVLKASQSGFLLVPETPFYAEGGGQVGDQGRFTTPTATGVVVHCYKQNDLFLHQIEVESGELKKGDALELTVGDERRQTASNHSATHLLHAALREILGSHVTQAGSSVDSLRLRFDFTHNRPVSFEEIEQIEDLVNQHISLAHEVRPEVMSHKEALASGALALFGEKYGDEVRVIRMGPFSCELCGGTHVTNTSQIRLFKIVTESGVSAGVRRIEAITHDRATQYVMKHTRESLKARSEAGIFENWQQFLESSQPALSLWIDARRSEVKNLERELKKLKGGQIDLDGLLAHAKAIPQSSGRVVLADIASEDREVLSQVADQLRNKLQSGVVVLVGQGEATHPLIVSVSKDLTGQWQAGALLKAAAEVMGGKGGGRPDFAQGSVPDRNQLASAFKKIENLLGVAD